MLFLSCLELVRLVNGGIGRGVIYEAGYDLGAASSQIMS